MSSSRKKEFSFDFDSVPFSQKEKLEALLKKYPEFLFLIQAVAQEDDPKYQPYVTDEGLLAFIKI
ncbi:hypothetical protein pv_345 [Pithovirus sibericum]|uniref:Uncharacterized protein n=1 Tax=Pithovirus sibericum TaxID=1450746 RepID=W5S6E8_9VIRU|nr:hypothetical protein pv_345 [Pithovirus sibericum]AHH01912.1 hypothetical protein pv_345 [Pithovirus sibericum]WIL05496.1 hypothetical protein pmam_457 [Pithovirus mammoth]